MPPSLCDLTLLNPFLRAANAVELETLHTGLWNDILVRTKLGEEGTDGAASATNAIRGSEAETANPVAERTMSYVTAEGKVR